MQSVISAASLYWHQRKYAAVLHLRCRGDMRNLNGDHPALPIQVDFRIQITLLSEGGGLLKSLSSFTPYNSPLGMKKRWVNLSHPSLPIIADDCIQMSSPDTGGLRLYNLPFSTLTRFLVGQRKGIGRPTIQLSQSLWRFLANCRHCMLVELFCKTFHPWHHKARHLDQRRET